MLSPENKKMILTLVTSGHPIEAIASAFRISTRTVERISSAAVRTAREQIELHNKLMAALDPLSD